MNIRQAMKMAWKSIWGKKGRSALTMLGIIIGIAAVMTIVSAINGYTEKTMAEFPRVMGTPMDRIRRTSLPLLEGTSSARPRSRWVAR